MYTLVTGVCLINFIMRPDHSHRKWVEVKLQFSPRGPVLRLPQVLFDRLRHYDVLEWLFWLNSHSNTTYQHMHGDKDTYRLAFGLAGKLQEHRQVALKPRDAMAVVMPPGHMPYLQHQVSSNHHPCGASIQLAMMDLRWCRG
jgi:hypothetical protein